MPYSVEFAVALFALRAHRYAHGADEGRRRTRVPVLVLFVRGGRQPAPFSIITSPLCTVSDATSLRHTPLLFCNILPPLMVHSLSRMWVVVYVALSTGCLDLLLVEFGHVHLSCDRGFLTARYRGLFEINMPSPHMVCRTALNTLAA